MKRMMTLVAAAAGLTACATPGAQTGELSAQDKATLERQLSGRSQTSGSRLDRLVVAAAAHPLGSDKNPVRADSPIGQRAYLARLKCADGSTPRFERRGSMGVGVYGNIVDEYDVDCGAAAPGRVSVRMDLYHPGYVELRAIPGFTIANLPAAPVT